MSTIEKAQAKAQKLQEYSEKQTIQAVVETVNWQFYIADDDSHAVLAKDCRSIKQPLVVNVIGFCKKDIQCSNLILIISNIPGEGKTFTLINLALSIAAELDENVLLIDADVSRSAEVLAALVDQMIFVITAEFPSQNIVMESVKTLTGCADEVLTLLNKTRWSLDSGCVGYGKY